MERVRIVHLYPQELSLYGDSGNVLCLKKRLEMRNIKAEIIEVKIGEDIPDFDIMFIGGGQDREMEIIHRDLRRKSEMLSYCVSCGKVILAICGGFQLLGEYYETADKSIMKMSSALPFYTVASKKRMIGNYVFETPFGTVAGFENHSGRTYLPNNLSPLGTVVSGFGNNGADQTEGVLFNNTFGTYAHGPVLPKNPALADELIRRALCCDELAEIDDITENLCHSYLVRKFS